MREEDKRIIRTCLKTGPRKLMKKKAFLYTYKTSKSYIDMLYGLCQSYRSYKALIQKFTF